MTLGTTATHDDEQRPGGAVARADHPPSGPAHGGNMMTSGKHDDARQHVTYEAPSTTFVDEGGRWQGQEASGLPAGPQYPHSILGHPKSEPHAGSKNLGEATIHKTKDSSAIQRRPHIGKGVVKPDPWSTHDPWSTGASGASLTQAPRTLSLADQFAAENLKLLEAKKLVGVSVSKDVNVGAEDETVEQPEVENFDICTPPSTTASPSGVGAAPSWASKGPGQVAN